MDIRYAAVDEYLQRKLRRLQVPGAALAVVEKGEIVHVRGFGKARPGGETPTGQTPFWIGSLTKSITALAAMQLVEGGKLDLDAPVQRYLRWFRVADVQESRRISVRHLLHQTSGLPCLAGEVQLADFDSRPDAAERQARALASVPLAHPAGAKFEYSNANYNLLGLVIEAASGEPYAGYVQRHIFDPLDMRHTCTSPAAAAQQGLAVGHRLWFAAPVAQSKPRTPGGSLAAGALLSTVEDLAHWLIIQLNGGCYRGVQIPLPGNGRRHWRPVGDQAAAGQTAPLFVALSARLYLDGADLRGPGVRMGLPAREVDAANWTARCFHATGGCTLMNKNTASYQVVELSPARRVLLSLLDLPRPKHCMYGLLEVDVTPVKQWIEECKAHTGEQLSFTGYLVFCLARAVEEDKMVQGYLRGRRQMVVFDDVDVGLMVEKKTGEKRTLTGHVIHAANRKSWREIHAEIRAAQSSPAPAGSAGASWFYSALLLPWPLPNLALALMAAAARRNPALFASLAGTVGVTAVGMFGEGQGGWGIAPVQHSLGLIVGSTAWKPAIVQGRVEPRELLNLTVTFDHAVVDGAPAARFTRRLVELIESGYGLGVKREEEHERADHFR